MDQMRQAQKVSVRFGKGNSWYFGERLFHRMGLFGGWGNSSVVEPLPSKYKALGFVLSFGGKKRRGLFFVMFPTLVPELLIDLSMLLNEYIAMGARDVAKLVESLPTFLLLPKARLGNTCL